MEAGSFVGKIRKYSVLCFLIPLITINLCLFLYKIMGDIEPYANIQWDQKIIKTNYKDFSKAHESLSFLNCPKYEFKTTNYDKEGKKLGENDNWIFESKELSLLHIGKIELEYNQNLNIKCIKNKRLTYFIVNNFKFLDKFLLSAKKNNKVGFSSNVKMPYIYGEVSISRTARYFPASIIFKPFIVLSALFLFLYWRNNFKLFENLKSKSVIDNFSKIFFYFGVCSSIFLALHALFLGLEYNSKLFLGIRRIIITSFIFTEIIAQIFLTLNLFKLKENLKVYVNNTIIKIKIIFVSMVFIITFLIFALLALGDPETSTKNILEWNYFSILLIYYMLSWLLWKKAKS